MAHALRVSLLGIVVSTGFLQVAGKREVSDAEKHASQRRALIISEDGVDANSMDITRLKEADASGTKAHQFAVDFGQDVQHRSTLGEVGVIGPQLQAELVRKAKAEAGLPKCNAGHCESTLQAHTKKTHKSKKRKVGPGALSQSKFRGQSKKMKRRRTRAMRRKERYNKARKLAKVINKVPGKVRSVDLAQLSSLSSVRSKKGRKSRTSAAHRHGSSSSEDEDETETDLAGEDEDGDESEDSEDEAQVNPATNENQAKVDPASSTNEDEANAKPTKSTNEDEPVVTHSEDEAEVNPATNENQAKVDPANSTNEDEANAKPTKSTKEDEPVVISTESTNEDDATDQKPTATPTENPMENALPKVENAKETPVVDATDGPVENAQVGKPTEVVEARKEGSEDENKGEDGGEDGDEDEDEDEDDDDEPTKLTKEQRMWLAHGWGIIFLSVILVISLVLLLRHEALRAFLWVTGNDEKRTMAPIGEEPTMCMQLMYSFFFGEGWFAFLFEIFVLVVGVTNFAVFAQATEAEFVKKHPDLDREEGKDKLADLVSDPKFWKDAQYWVEVPSLIFVGAVCVLRLMAVGAHPKWSVFGHSAWWRYLLQDIYIQADIIACIPSCVGLLDCAKCDKAVNCLWFVLLRGFAFVGKSRTQNIFGDILKENGKLLIVSSMFGIALWVTLSGFYYLSNKDAAESRYEEAVDENGKEWQRFESIPSSMLYCLINLLKEHPLADVHFGFFARTCVVFSVIIGVPIMAVPTGIVGTAIEAKTRQYLADTRLPPEEEQVEEEPGPLRTFLNSILWRSITFFLAYGSIVLYFWSTARTIIKVTPGDEDEDTPTEFEYKDVACWFHKKGTECLLEFKISPGLVAVTDGVVGSVFVVDFVLRLMTATVTWGHGLVDLLSCAPGIAHACMFCGGVRGLAIEWMAAIMCIRVLKMDRFLDSFKDIKEIFYDNRYVFGVTVFIGGMLLMFFTTVLYFTERDGIDGDITEVFGSVKRGLWGEMINLHGEYPWCDFTAEGKATMVFIGLFGIGLFCVPLGIFGNGFADRLKDQAADVEVENSSWQELDVPEPGPQRRVHEFLYGKSLGFSVYFYMMVGMIFLSVATTSTGTLTYYSDSLVEDKDGDGEIEPNGDGITFLDCQVPAKKKQVEEETAKWEANPDRDEDDESPFQCLAFCHLDEKCTVQKNILRYVDIGLLVVFAVDLGLRLFVHTYKYLLSWVGWIDILSLVAFIVTTVSWRIRESAFHPNYYDDDPSDDAVALLLIVRLCRIFSLESLKPAIHVMYNVIRINWRPLLKAFYSVLCMWFICATLLYMFERENDTPDDGMRMKDRYRDIPTAMQYTIVHLKGDYPLWNYTASTRLLLTFVIIFGIAFIGAPTGIFAAGFGSYFAKSREQELREITRKKIEKLMWAVAKIGIQWRRIHKRQGIAHEQTERAKGPEAEGAFSCSLYFRDFMNQRTCWGNFFVSMAQFLLVVNVCATVVHSIPEIRNDNGWDNMFDMFEVLCTIVFSLEYIFRFLAAGAIAYYNYSRLRWLISARNILDLICIAPMYIQIIIVPALCDGEWNCHKSKNGKDYTWLTVTLESVVIIRALRLLQFTCIKYEVQLILKIAKKSCANLWAPSVIALAVWSISSTLFMWVQCFFNGDNMIPGQEEEEWMTSIPDAMYWCAIFLLGEWANVDFTDGAGSRMCILYCLFGVMLFTIPMGIIMDAVTSTLAEEQADLDAIKKIDKALRQRTESVIDAYDRKCDEEDAETAAAEETASAAEKAARASARISARASEASRSSVVGGAAEDGAGDEAQPEGDQIQS